MSQGSPDRRLAKRPVVRVHAGCADRRLHFFAQRVFDRTQHACLGLLGQDAAAPGKEDVRRGVGLQQRRQLGLVSLVLEELHVDLDTWMGGLVLPGDALHDGELLGYRDDVHPVDSLIGRDWRDRRHSRQQQRCSKRKLVHDFLPFLFPADGLTSARLLPPAWPRAALNGYAISTHSVIKRQEVRTSKFGRKLAGYRLQPRQAGVLVDFSRALREKHLLLCLVKSLLEP